ncbi:hypothetical protein AAC387_Pa02g2589 [Persea americana]
MQISTRCSLPVLRPHVLHMANGNERRDPINIETDFEERGILEQIAEASLASVVEDVAGSQSSERLAANRRQQGGAIAGGRIHVGKAGRKRQHHVCALSHFGGGIRCYQRLQPDQSHHQQRHGNCSTELDFGVLRFLYLALVPSNRSFQRKEEKCQVGL